MNYSFRFGVAWDNAGFLLAGVRITLVVTLAALAIGVVLGLVVGLMRVSKRGALHAPAVAYVEMFRNTPTLVQLMWIYYCLPLLTGINIGALLSCSIALGVNGAAYIAEIFRAGITAVERGQAEAARSLGLSYMQTMRKVVLPQAVRKMIPPFVNEAVTLLKFSSLVSVLGVADLTYQGNVVATTNFRPIEIFSAIAALYFGLCTVLSYCARLLERRLAMVD